MNANTRALQLMREPAICCSIGFDGIAIVPERIRRSLNEDVVKALVESFKTIGQQQPIVVRPFDGTGYLLIAGRHRLEAARKLKLLGIDAMVVNGLSADQALIAEIDENPVRADLSPAETAAHHAERKPADDRLHPETKPGAIANAGKKSGQDGHSRERYTKNISPKTGRSERAVRRDVTRAKSVRDVIFLIGTLLDKGDELDALANLAKVGKKAAEILTARAADGEQASAKTEVKKVRRQTKERDLGLKQTTLPTKRYGVILADPEWRFEVYSRDKGLDRAADNLYPTNATAVIAARDVASIAAADSVLFLWATVPMLPNVLRVMEPWGFKYRSHAVWNKDRVGTGYWFRNKHEILLVGAHGTVPAPAPGTQWDNVVPAMAI